MIGLAGIIFGLVIDLIRELYGGVVRVLRAREFFAQYHSAGLDSCEVKSHVQVGRAGSALHVKHLHIVVRIVFEDVIPAFTQCKFLCEQLLNLRFRYTSRLVVISENIVKCGVSSAALHFAGPEVDRSCHRAVHAAQINDQLSVHIEPEIIVSGEFEDDVVAPCIQSVGSLRK